jgi:acetyl esterase
VSLDPHVSRILDILAATGTTAASHVPTIGEQRLAFGKLMSLSEWDVPIGRVDEHSFTGPESTIRMRIYTPRNINPEPIPALVYFHGGGLVAGSLDTHEGLCRTIANETGCRIVSVDYRLAPEHKFPAAVMDCHAATIWTFEHANDLGIDSERIAVSGDSAGATLAAVVCQIFRHKQEVTLAAQLLLCPIMDFAGETESRTTYAEGHLLNKMTMERDLRHYVPAGISWKDPRISPLRATDLSGLPPAYIHTAECDPLRDEGRAYADRLTHAGIEVKYTCHPGMIHLFYGMASVIPYARTAMRHIGGEIRDALC